MLDRLRALNSSTHEAESKKWQIEKNLLSLVLCLDALDKSCAKPPLKEQKSACMDFKQIVIPDLERRINYLEKHSPKLGSSVEQHQHYLVALQKIRTDLLHDKKEYEKLETTLASLSEQTKDICKLLRNHIPALRSHINAIADEQDKINIISGLKPVVSVKILLTIFEEMREKNTCLLFTAIMKLTGFDLKKNHANKSFSLICHKHFGVEVEDAVDHIVKSHETKEINENICKDFMQKLTSDIWKALQKNIHTDTHKHAADVANITAIMEMELYLALAVRTYQFTDDIQMDAGLARKRFVIFLNLKEILNPFAVISTAARNIVISPELERLFAEAVIWLKGIYKSSHDEIPPFLTTAEGMVTEPGFSYITDEENRDLFKWKPPLTRLVLGDNHRHHAAALCRQPAPVLCHDGNEEQQEEKRQFRLG